MYEYERTNLMQTTSTVYVPVWQTWNLINPRHMSSSSQTSLISQSDEACITRIQGLRERMQIARIQKRLTIHELAQKVECDVEMLASFERGDGIVTDEIQGRIRSALQIT